MRCSYSILSFYTDFANKNPDPSQINVSFVSMMKFRALLSPSDRHSEILFGLIMMLAITGTVEIGTGTRKAVISAGIGACIAWGVVDSIIYFYSNLLERGRIALAAREASTCIGDGCDIRTIKEELEGTIVDTLGEHERHEVAQHILMCLKPVENHTRATRDDILGGMAAGMLVLVSGIPILLPFLLFNDIWAMRLSRIIGLVMLYVIGCRCSDYGRYHCAWRMKLVVRYCSSVKINIIPITV